MTAFEAGQSVGRYRILRPLGSGAMGVVYLAQDPQIERLLAIKTVRLEAERDEEIEERTQRLLREAKTAGRLIHPHIVTLFDAGEHDGLLFLAFEYVEGRSLANRLRSGPPIRVGEALRIAREAAEGLDHAHRRGIVHRDVKPANLLLASDGKLKISDFGIAKMAGQATELTVTGSVVGSPHYLSPEQVRGEELDGRSDLFSLGVVLYEMLGGRRPFDGDTFTTLLYKILHAEPEPIRLRPGLEPDLARLLGELLAKDPDRRPPDGARVAEALAALKGGLPTEVLAAPGVVPPEVHVEGDTAGGETLAGTRPTPIEPPPPPPPPPPAPAQGTGAAAVGEPRRPAPSEIPEGGAGPVSPGRRRIWIAAAVALMLLAAGGLAGLVGLRLVRGELGGRSAGAPDRQALAEGVPAGPPEEEAARDDHPAPFGPVAARPDEARPEGGRAEPAGGAPAPGARQGAEGGAADDPAGAGNELSPRARRLEQTIRQRPELREAAKELVRSRAGRLPPAVDQKLQTGLVLTFDVHPPEAFVLLDGTVLGRASELDPAAGGSAYTLPGPGTHRIKLRSPGMVDHHVLVEASDSGPPRTRVSARLEPASASELDLGDLKLFRVQEAVGFEVLPPAARSRARVLVDGEPAGRASRFPGRFIRSATWLRLEPGRHRVSVVAPGFTRRDFAVEVSGGASERRRRIEVRLLPEG